MTNIRRTASNKLNQFKLRKISTLEARLMLAGDVCAACPSIASDAGSSYISKSAQASGSINAVNQLVIVDSSIAEDTTWMHALPENADLVVLPPGVDPIQQITEILRQRQGLQSVHLLCHGSDGVLQLAGAEVTNDTLSQQVEHLSLWRHAFAEGGDLLIYGCDVAAGASGKLLVSTLSQHLAVDVAASTNRTGPTRFGGDWELEHVTGDIDSAFLLDHSQLEHFHGYLAIEIFAAGTTGDELLELEVDNQVVATWFVRGTDAENGAFFPYRVDLNGVSADRIRLKFTNDYYNTDSGIDRNLRIDRLVIDGVTLETEDAGVFASGVYVPGQGITSGFLQSEYLHADGYFQFPSSNNSTIEVALRGETGTESAQLLIDGSVIQTINNIPQNNTLFSFVTDGSVTADRVRVAFINDVYEPLAGVDRNLIVDYVRIDGVTFETEASSTFSTGTWRSQDGVQSGYRQSETLHTNGYFQYGQNGDFGNSTSGTFSLATSDITVVENSGTATLEIARIGGSSGTASIDVFTANESAVAGEDYVAKSERLFFADGETSKTFSVNLINDSVAEVTKQFSVRLDNPAGAGLLAPRTSLITLLDDDSGLPRYASFDSPAGLRFNGTATTNNGTLELTSDAARQAGTAFFEASVVITERTSFQSTFSFRIGGGAGTAGADGLAFLLQNSAQGLDALGRSGGYVGYDTIGNSIAIEFDNYAKGSNAASTIAVVLNGDNYNPIVEAVAPFDLNDGSLYYAWIEYNGDTNNLAVFISQSTEKPYFAVLKTNISLDQIVGNEAFAGFSAGNFDLPNFHQVTSWNFSLDTPNSDPQLNPSGSVLEQDIYTGLNQPVAIDWSSDGRNIYIAEKGGVIKVARDGASQLSVLLDISAQVNNVQDRGLIDFALHPDFQNNGYIYLLYTYDPPEVFDNLGNVNAGPDGQGNRAGRLMRVQADANTGYTTIVNGSETILLGKNSTWNNFNAYVDSTSDLSQPESGFSPVTGYVQDFLKSDSLSHTVGSLAFGVDGNLFVSIGDGSSYNQTDSRALSVQNVGSLSGKVLRIDPLSGQGLTDNPFYNGDLNSNESKVYQLGLRNPWRLTVDQATGQLFIGETGLASYEEINTGPAGTNFGWPYYEGGQGFNSQTPGYRNLPQAQNFYRVGGSAAPAVIAFQHQAGANVIVLGDVVYNSDLGQKYEGDLFYADLYRGVVNHADVNDAGQITNIETFTTDAQFVVDIQQGPDRALYYANLVEGTVGKWLIV